MAHEILASLRTLSRSSERVPSSSSSRDDGSQPWQLSSQSSMPTSQLQSFNVENELSSNTLQVSSSREHKGSRQVDMLTPDGSIQPSAITARQTCDTTVPISCLSDINADGRGTARGGGLLRSISQPLSRKQRLEPFGKRRNTSFTIHDDTSNIVSHSANECSIKDAEQVPKSKDTTKSSQGLRKTSSFVRLSMSLEGKAQVTTSTGTTPSPTRPEPVAYPDIIRRPNSGLQRSFSAVEPAEGDSMPSSFLRRAVTGRSRDARTWEFYCDKDARDALTEQAEREESGSATAVIALIKSNSNQSKAVATKSNKRNAHNHKLKAAKRLKAGGGTSQRLKLGRSQSSLAKMQTVSNTVISRTEGPWETHCPRPAPYELKEGDSDKENWVPGTQQRSPLRRRPAGPSNSQRRILEESLQHPSNLDASTSQEREFLRKFSACKSVSSATSSMSEKDHRGSEADESASLGGGKASPRATDDMDCVQNLLSLSQAAWQ